MPRHFIIYITGALILAGAVCLAGTVQADSRGVIVVDGKPVMVAATQLQPVISSQNEQMHERYSPRVRIMLHIPEELIGELVQVAEASIGSEQNQNLIDILQWFQQLDGETQKAIVDRMQQQDKRTVDDQKEERSPTNANQDELRRQRERDEKRGEERYGERSREHQRQDDLRQEQRREDIRADERRRAIRLEQERRAIELQQQRLTDQRLEEQRRQQQLENQRRDEQRRYDSYRR